MGRAATPLGTLLGVFPGWRTARLAFACVVASLLLGAFGPAAQAKKPGADVDLSFGGDGTVATSLPVEVTDAALDRQGRIVLGGIRLGQPSVARLLEDGTLDPSFGGDGESHEGSVSDTRDVEIEVLPDGSVQALALVETGADKYLRIDFDANGVETGAVRFDGSAGAAGLTPGGGAVATRLDDQLETRMYDFLGGEDPGFDPGGQPQSQCFPMAGCHYYFPDELTVGESGTVVQTLDSMHTNSPCVGAKLILSLAPGAKDFETEALVGGCGVNEVFSIAAAPDDGFLVSGWGAPPAKASFVRLRPDGSVDESFGDDGRAETADLGVDNLFVSYPAFAQSGAFTNSLTQPREPTLRLKPSRFSSSGAFKDKFDAKTTSAEFGASDGLSAFAPHTTLLSESKQIIIVGTGQTASGPVAAIARWRPR